MKCSCLSFLFLLSFLSMVSIPAQIPSLPEGAQTNWVVAEPEEIVSYLIFDPGTVRGRVPSFQGLLGTDC